MRKTLAILGIAAVMTLAGCSALPTAHAKSSSATPPKPRATYSTVAELKDAFVKAGGSCPDWVQSDRVTLAAQSGDCSGETVLSIYLNKADRDQVVANMRVVLADSGLNLLVGENWIINTPDPNEYAAKLGGLAITK